MKTGHSKCALQTELQGLFENLSRDLSRLLHEIEFTLPIASRAADLGTRVAGKVLEEHYRLVRHRNSTPLWRKLLNKDSWAAKQLEHDLILTSDSVEGLKRTSQRLADLRSTLGAYHNNVEVFKVRFFLSTSRCSGSDYGWLVGERFSRLLWWGGTWLIINCQ